MAFKEREAIIQKIVAELCHESKEAGKNRLLLGWREKLTKESPPLPLHQIDEVVRKVRRRLETAGR